MISTVAMFCEDVLDVEVNASDTMATIVGKDGTLYLHGSREDRLNVLRSWAWAESVFLAESDTVLEVAS